MSSGCRGNDRHRWCHVLPAGGDAWAVDCDGLTVKLSLDAQLDRTARPCGRRSGRLTCDPIKLTPKGG
jgi:hypothetical protein